MKFIQGILALGLLALSVTTKANAYPFDIQGYGIVKSVVDGDTYDILSVRQEPVSELQRHAAVRSTRYINGSTFRVRLASVDTEESNHPDKSRNTKKGKLTKIAVKKMLEGRNVHYKCYDIGKYGRAICNISLVIANRKVDVGAKLISLGLSKYETKYGVNPYMHDVYKRISR